MGRNGCAKPRGAVPRPTIGDYVPTQGARQLFRVLGLSKLRHCACAVRLVSGRRSTSSPGGGLFVCQGEEQERAGVAQRHRLATSFGSAGKLIVQRNSKSSPSGG